MTRFSSLRAGEAVLAGPISARIFNLLGDLAQNRLKN
jgi:hypothetical protein